MITTFWDWYTELFSDPDNKVRLAAWTATVGTCTFLITFFVKPIRKWIWGLFKRPQSSTVNNQGGKGGNASIIGNNGMAIGGNGGGSGPGGRGGDGRLSHPYW